MNNKIRKILLEEEEDDDFLLYYYYLKRKKPVLPLFTSNVLEGSYELIKRQLNYNDKKFRKHCRLNKKQFKFVLSLIFDDLAPKTLKKAVSPEEKLYLTLRFLTTGDNFKCLHFQYGISKSYISRIVRQVLQLLRVKLVPIAMPPPTINEFKKVEKEFWEKWNVPNCIGSIDGKHIRIKPVHRSRPQFSTVLLGIVDANYKFIAIDVGSYGKEEDGNIFKKSEMGKKIWNNDFNIPEPKNLPGTNDVFPHFLIGDKAFPLNSYMMKSYSQRIASQDDQKNIFNCRINRARHVSKNAFGLLSKIFKALNTTMTIMADTCDDLVVVACCLYNILRNGYLENDQIPFYHCSEDKVLTNRMIKMACTSGVANNEGLRVRNKLKEYFSSQIEVSWQNDSENHIQ